MCLRRRLRSEEPSIREIRRCNFRRFLLRFLLLSYRQRHEKFSTFFTESSVVSLKRTKVHRISSFVCFFMKRRRFGIAPRTFFRSLPDILFGNILLFDSDNMTTPHALDVRPFLAVLLLGVVCCTAESTLNLHFVSPYFECFLLTLCL